MKESGRVKTQEAMKKLRRKEEIRRDLRLEVKNSKHLREKRRSLWLSGGVPFSISRALALSIGAQIASTCPIVAESWLCRVALLRAGI
jgi:hypothetical protein